ncbi:MAG: NAD-dependent epimerase/dehydratase family protein [bacterium]|nr:NAD-dependent epimerase/dehydratase family protein [bacterium]
MIQRSLLTREEANFYKDKKILVTGGTGMIGVPLVEMLIEAGAKVRIASLDDKSRAHPEAEFSKVDLRVMANCMEVCSGIDIVFSLAGIKGSPKMMVERPASYFVPQLLFNTSLMEAARQCEVQRYMYTSSIGVYAPAEIFQEDSVWKTFPSQNDRFGGWVKRIGELQAEAYRIEYGWDKISITRPANVYGPYDNFDPANAMVVPSLIKRVLDGENPLVVWGDGSNIRDIVHARDVANGMMIVVMKGVQEPVNLGCGEGVSVKDVAEVITRNVSESPKIEWDISKHTGDKKRIMDISRANSYGWQPQISLEDGIKETMEWYLTNKEMVEKRYNPFK